jgi:hypothetical protein
VKKIEIEVYSVDEKLPEADDYDILVRVDNCWTIAPANIFEVCPSGITHWCELPNLTL